MQEARQRNEAKQSLPSPPTTNPLEPKVFGHRGDRLLVRLTSQASHRSLPLEPKTVTPSCPPPEPEAYQKPERKRKRSQEADSSQDLPHKRLRPDTNGNPPPADININTPPTDINGSRLLADANGGQPNPRVQAWLEERNYPKEYFESGERTWEDIKADTFAQRPEADKMDDPRLARKKSAASLRRQVLEASTDAPTEKTEDKSQPYRSPGYVAELEDQRSYLYDAPEGISDKSKRLCQKLLSIKQAVPQDSLFHDDRFEEACQKVRDRNEARIVEDISPLIAPSPETLKMYGAVELKHLVFNTNERWDNSRPVTKTRPQPDGSVGFNRSAYTEDQVQKLLPWIGNRVPYDYLSLFLATWKTFFPFFAREAKSGTGDLNVADRQNAHSMTIAVRGIVELFWLVNREHELHRELVAFSISHDATSVKIYGHYATIENRVPSFWRHPIHSFDFTAQDGKDRWTAYQFTKNVYFEFMPTLHTLICSAIDQLPLKTASSVPRSILPQQVPLNASFTSTDLESEQPDSQEIATSAPGSQDVAGSKKRKVTKAVLEQENEQYKGQNHQLLGQIDLLKQQQHSIASSGNESEGMAKLRQENEQFKGQVHQLLGQVGLLQQQQQQQAPNANSGNDSEIVAMLRQQNAEMKEQMDRQQEQMSKLMETLQSLSAQPKPKQRGKKST